MRLLKTTLKRLAVFMQLLLIAFIAVSVVKAQPSSVDLSFNAIPEKALNSALTINFILQPDNKIIAFGSFQVVNGVVKNQIVRFNADGSLDETFNCTTCDFNISNALLQPDGKIVVSGSTNNLIPVVYRLNPDGSRDASFTSPIATAMGSAFVNAIQPDGKILVTQSGNIGGFFYADLYRLNTDGTFDTTFTRIGVGSGRLVRTAPQKISVAPDGKILVATNTTSAGNSNGELRRYNANGTVDSTFEPPTIVGGYGSSGGFNRSFINDFDVQSDGSIVIIGSFVSVNAVSRLNIARLFPTGNVDLAFNSTNIPEAGRVKILPDGKVLLSNNNQFYRLNVDGSTDNSFASPTNLTLINNWMLDSAGRIFIYGVFLENGVSVTKFARLNQDGSVESSLTAAFGIGGAITAIAAQSDGKVIIAGDFVRVGGVPRVSIARVFADGTLDTTFDPGSGFNVPVSKILVQPDGKILVAGTFFSFNGIRQPRLVRLNADGSLDNTFNGNFEAAGEVSAMVLQSDGKILIGGRLQKVSGQFRDGFFRLNADGSFDLSFNPVFGSASIRSIIVQTDGKIMVGGLFSGVNGFSRANLVRLNSDGSLDTSFNAGNISPVNQIEIQADGKYLALTSTILRLNNNGTSDATFLVPIFSSSNINIPALYQFLLQPDGSILVGGNFTTVNNAPRTNLVRLQPNGILDTNFLPNGANGAVRTIVRQANGQILVGGDFSIIGGVTRLSIARLNVNSFRLTTPFDFDGDGRADVSVFRPSNGFWYQLRGTNNSFFAMQFGQAGDRPAPADYDGDGKTDIAVFRDTVAGAGISAYFYITRSSDNSFVPVQFGATGDVPVSGDWDGDGRGDLAVYRDGSLTGGQSFFYYRPSSQPTVNFNTIPLGVTGDKPVVGDFDGDGRLDPAVFRPSTAIWIILRTSVNQTTQIPFGLPTDIPAPADFNGDGMANLAVFRPSNGFWYVARPTGIAAQNFDAVQFGANGDRPVPADYDGDGRADVAVFRPSNGSWYILRTTEELTGVQFGTSEDKPIPNAYIY